MTFGSHTKSKWTKLSSGQQLSKAKYLNHVTVVSPDISKHPHLTDYCGYIKYLFGAGIPAVQSRSVTNLAVCHSLSEPFEWLHKAKSRVHNRVCPWGRGPVLLWTDPWVHPPSGWQWHSEWVRGTCQWLSAPAGALSPGQWVRNKTPEKRWF